MAKKLLRGRILYFLDQPITSHGELPKYVYHHDGGLLIHQGKVEACQDFHQFHSNLTEDIELIHYPDKLIMPGFIDTHIHYPQIDVIGSPGKDLIDWLERFTFPSEFQYQDRSWAAQSSEFFLKELLCNGTTSALVFGTVHPESVDELFKASDQENFRMIVGKVAMDRNCPEFLRDTPLSSYEQSLELIEKWHLNGRQQYALTPRFAITSSEEQLKYISKLAMQYPDMVMQTHLAENTDEVAWIRELFPKSRSYLDVYDHYGLLRPRAVFAHSIYIDQIDRKRLYETKSSVSFCPSSNLFLGSGLMDQDLIQASAIQIGLGTDIGGGTSFNMFKTMAKAYEVTHLRGKVLSSFELFYSATLAGAKVLGIDGFVGSFEPGKEADLIVIDLKPTSIMERRMGYCKTLEEELFVCMILGDDRNIYATYLMGEKKYQRN